FALAQILLADRFDRLRRYEDAIAAYRAVDATSPFHHMASLGLALDLSRAGNKDEEALDAYDHAVTAIGSPSARDWPLFFARAMVRERLKDLKGSEADIDTALKLAPNEAQLLNYLGYSWVDRGEHISQALAMLEKARALRPYDGYI